VKTFWIHLSSMTTMQSLVSAWPDIDGKDVLSLLKPVDRSRYPELERYSREEIYRDIHGQGGLFFACDLARELELKPGMKVLDLACGDGETSVFLAKQYGVQVFAVDKRLDESRLLSRAMAEGVAPLITPRKLDARFLPFAAGFFDAVFCLNAYFYFGTDDLFLPYLLGFVRDGGRIAIGSPCYRAELTPATPEDFLIEFPDCLAVHSPEWWRAHFEKTRGVDILRCESHPQSREFWEDFIRFQVEKEEPRAMAKARADALLDFLRVLNLDQTGFLSHLFLAAQKRKGVHFGASLEWYK
jgi:SAM-dependent methyltransferase